MSSIFAHDLKTVTKNSYNRCSRAITQQKVLLLQIVVKVNTECYHQYKMLTNSLSAKCNKVVMGQQLTF